MQRIAIGAVMACSLLVGFAARAEEFRLTSPDISEGGTIKAEQLNKGSGCTGGNISPALRWSGAPPGTKSFAITLFDPDAFSSSGWWHWIIIDIPANVTELPKNAGDPKRHLAPKGSLQTKTDFGTPGYGGPCPPTGDDEHRYVFKIYALKVDKLPVKPESGAIPLHLHFHSLAQATLSGVYSRPGGKIVP